MFREDGTSIHDMLHANVESNYMSLKLLRLINHCDIGGGKPLNLFKQAARYLQIVKIV
jgi:hypothetical protein